MTESQGQLPAESYPSPDTYQALEGLYDPLAVAALALAKLKALGHSGVIYAPETTDEGITATATPEASYDNVTSLDAYRETHTPPAEAEEALDEADLLSIEAVPELQALQAEVTVSEPRKKRQSDGAAPKQIESHLIQRAQTGDKFSIEEICRRALPLVEKLATYYTLRLPPHSGVSYEDLRQVGWTVVPDVLKRFDPDRGTQFETLLVYRVKGAMIDYNRDLMPISRSDYAQLKAIQRQKNPEQRKRMLHELVQGKAGDLEKPGGKPKKSKHFPAAASLMNENGLIRLAPESMQGYTYDDGDANDWQPAAPDDVAQTVIQELDREVLMATIKRLPPQEREVLMLYEGLKPDSHGSDGKTTLKAIGMEKGLTESRISQIHTQAIRHLAALMSGVEIKQSFPNRMRHLNNGPGKQDSVGHLLHLTKTCQKLHKFAEAPLSEEEISTLTAALPTGWTHRSVSLQGSQYTLLTRHNAGDVMDLTPYQEPVSDRRVIGRRDQDIHILIKELRLTDLETVARLELRLIELRQFPINQAVAGLLSRSQRTILANLFKGNGEIALKQGIEQSTLRTHIHNAGRSLGVPDADKSGVRLAILAAAAGILPMNEIPSDTTEGLSSREREVLVAYYEESSYGGTARRLYVSISTIRTHLQNVYAKMGAFNHRQAMLMAFRDGLIPPPDLSHYGK